MSEKAKDIGGPASPKIPVNPPKGVAGYDYVVMPSHYNRGKVETIDLIENAPANLANAMKYLDRHDGKPGATIIHEAHKARWYILREFMRMGYITEKQWHEAVGREVPPDGEGE